MPIPHFRQKLSTLFGLSIAELGLLPSETEETKEASSAVEIPPAEIAAQPILRQAPVFDPAIPPPSVGDHGLVGRDDLLASLKQRLLSGAPIVLALNGLPGVGKTRWQRHWRMMEVRAHFPDGVLSAGAPLSLQAMIGMSDQQVSKEARAALRALSAFPPRPNIFSTAF